VNSFAKRSLDTARARFRELEVTEISNTQKDIELVKSSWYLALKIRLVRGSPVQANPFAQRDESTASSSPVCLEVQEAKAIHQYYCRCPHYGSSTCESDAKTKFQTIGRDGTPPAVFKGYNSTRDVIDYFKNEVKQGRQALYQANSQETMEYLEAFIKRKESVHSQLVKKKETLIAQQLDVQKRIEALEEAVKIGNTTGMSKEEELAARNGSKSAALILHLKEVQEKGEQTIVFSYWHDTLALVQKSLKANGLSVAFCNGRTGNAMSKTIKEFTDGEVSILLLSAQVKASGANLQVATNVVLLDPAGSSAEHGATLEQQAIGRAVRMGQENAVKVVRFCVKDTIEEELFNEIDLAAAKLVTRNNDSTYMCENAHKSLDKKVLEKKKEAKDDEVCMGESISVKERVARTMAEAKAKNEIIVIDDSDDEDTEVGDGKPKAAPSGVPMQAPVTSNSSVKVKPESAEGVASAKRSNEEVTTESQAATSPDKRARIESETTTPKPTKWKCDFCDDAKFENYDLAVAHESTCQKSIAENKTHDSVMEDLAAAKSAPSMTFSSTGPSSLAVMREEYVKAVGKITVRDVHWFRMLVQLRQVKKDSGEAYVRGERCPLGKWCQYQRREYKKHTRGIKGPMNEERIRLLNEIDFPWSHAEQISKKSPLEANTRVISPTSVVSVVADIKKSSNSTVVHKLHSSLPTTDQMEVELQPQVGSYNTQATPDKVQTKTENEDEGRVVSPSADQIMEVSTEAAKEVGLDASPPPQSTEGSRGISNTAHATPPKLQSNEAVADAERVVSPPADRVVDSAEASDEEGLKNLLVKCEIGQYLKKFQNIQVTSAAQLLDNLQDLTFMQRLVLGTGLSATEVIKLQILANPIVKC